MSQIWIAIVIIIVILGSGCAGTPPVEDFTLARAALRAARSAGAPRYAPGLWSRAENRYQKAQDLYQDRYYEDAKKMFRSARKSAERAENSTRLKKFKSGEGF